MRLLTLQTRPDRNEPFDVAVGKVTGFSLHAGVAARARDRKKLERSCRYIASLVDNDTRPEVRRIDAAAGMARLALLLALPLAAHMVGETLIADGGYVLE